MPKGKPRIKVEDLPRDVKVSQEEMKKVTGGGIEIQPGARMAKVMTVAVPEPDIFVRRW